MTALAMDVRELSFAEVNEVAGGPIWAIVGGIAGGAMEYADRADDGDMTAQDWVGVAGGAAMGASGLGLAGRAGSALVRVAIRVSR